jgi:hypothetical protein
MGTFVKSLPVPHEVENTTLFPAGAVTLGLEYRVFDAAAEAAKLTAEEIAATGKDSLFNQGGGVDRGVCVHVFGTDDQAEYLRFDCFLDEPHYHYIVPGDGNMLIHFDQTSNGPMLEWALDAIGKRLGQMLALVGATTIVANLDDEEVRAALRALAPQAREQMSSY